MTAPSTFHSAPYDGRTEADPLSTTGFDLIVDWAEGQKPIRHREGVFAARLTSRCSSCPAWITPGDEVQYGVDDQLEHVDCPDDLTVGAKGVCGGCFLEMPLSGVCGVC